MAGKQAKNKGNPYPELPLYLIIYSGGKEPQPYLLNFLIRNRLPESVKPRRPANLISDRQI